jgi:tyrosine-protein kinase Etk/Wzc
VLLSNRIVHDEDRGKNFMKPLPSHATAGAPEDEIDLAAILHELRGHKWLLLLTTLVCFSFGLLYALKQPAQYQSNLLLQVNSKKGAMDAGDISKQIMSGGSSNAGSVSTQIALMQSRFILEPVIESLGLDIQVKEQSYSKWRRFLPWVHPKVLSISIFNVPQENINQAFQLVVDKPGHISLYGEENKLLLSGAMGKALKSSDGQIQLQAEGVVLPEGTTFRLVKRSTASTAKSLATSLQVKEAEGKNRFDATGVLELSLKGKNKKEVLRILNTIGDTARSKSAQNKAEEASQTLTFLHEQLPVTKKSLELSEKNLNQYRAKSGKIDIQIQTQFLLKQLAELDKQLSELQLKEIEMKQEYKKSHPVWLAQAAQVKAVLAQRKNLEAQLKRLPASDQVAVNLMRDVEVKQSLYLLLLNKIQELEVIKAGTVSDVRILSRATYPDNALPGKGRGFLLGGAFIGFMLGVMIIFGRKLLSSQVDDPYWSERYLNLPSVGIIPYCLEQKENLISLKKLPLIAHLHSKSSATEALRSLRTSLQVTLATASNNVISILGISPNVGKTFVSTNLAYLLATAGKRVLLIDSDLRKGTLHKYFDLKVSPGLSDVLEKDLSVEDVLRETTHSNLSVIPRGSYPKHPAELLGSERFKDLIKNCSELYDIVLIDTAPVLLVTDAVLVASNSATNLVVFGSGVHEPAEIERAMKPLQNAGVYVNGSIFNFHKEQTKNYYYGKYYSDAYYEDTNLEKALE